MGEKSSHGNSKSQRQKHSVKHQLPARFNAAGAEAAAIDLQAPERRVRQGNHEYGEQRSYDEACPPHTRPNNQ